jgi:hypothetical protein
MSFLEIRIGRPGTLSLDTVETRYPFTFPTAVRSAHALLQSFYLQSHDPDRHIKDVHVSLTTFFDPVQSTTSGEVGVEIELTDSSEEASILAFESDTIATEVRLLVVGV